MKNRQLKLFKMWKRWFSCQAIADQSQLNWSTCSCTASPYTRQEETHILQHFHYIFHCPNIYAFATKTRKYKISLCKTLSRMCYCLKAKDRAYQMPWYDSIKMAEMLNTVKCFSKISFMSMCIAGFPCSFNKYN